MCVKKIIFQRKNLCIKCVRLCKISLFALYSLPTTNIFASRRLPLFFFIFTSNRNNILVVLTRRYARIPFSPHALLGGHNKIICTALQVYRISRRCGNSDERTKICTSILADMVGKWKMTNLIKCLAFYLH